VFLRGRQMAMLAELAEGPVSEHGARFSLAPGVKAGPVPGRRAFRLTAGRGRSARVLPIGLPCLPYPTDRGSFQVNAGSLCLRQLHEGARGWLPLLVSWSPERDRRPVRWRLLTVTERSRRIPAEAAFACRIAWGTAESLLIYRSLAAPERRAFLGYQTTCRLFMGLFTAKGDVEPILEIAD
jgi:hypothetical protein